MALTAKCHHFWEKKSDEGSWRRASSSLDHGQVGHVGRGTGLPGRWRVRTTSRDLSSLLCSGFTRSRQDKGLTQSPFTLGLRELSHGN